MPYYLGIVESRAYILFYYEVIESKYRRLIAMQRLPLCLTIMSDYLNFKPKNILPRSSLRTLNNLYIQKGLVERFA